MKLTHVVAAIAAGLFCLAAGAEDGAKPPEKLVVAVLDFEAGVEEVKSVAGSLPDLFEVALAAEKNVTLVTRRDLKRLADEYALNLSGLVGAGEGARVGKLVGAEVLLLGRVTLVDQEVVITARLIGAETGVFLPAVARGPFAKDLAPLVDLITAKVRSLLVERGGELRPPPDPVDAKLTDLAKQIADLGVKLPSVGVLVFEEHVGNSPRQADPAAQTAIQSILKALGFPLTEVAGRELSDALRAFHRGEGKFPARFGVGVDVLVLGEGFSEFAGRTGPLVSAKGRLEVRAVRVADGKILSVYQDSRAAADLAERFAGKKALEELGREAALALALPVAKDGVPPAK